MPPLARSSGVLLHPTSLPGPYGIGDFGPEAVRWVQTLAVAKQSWWQILPLGPTGAGNSPYQSFSAFAGNIALLSPDALIRDGLLDPSFVAGVSFPAGTVDFTRVMAFKTAMVRETYDRFRSGKGPAGLREEFDLYRFQQADWLIDYASFMTIRDGLGGRALADWPTDLLHRDPVAVAAVAKLSDRELQQHAFGQFLIDRQWTALKAIANEHRVSIIGDAPIFVSADSADVWAHPNLFLLDAARKPTVVAGVPPDYFSPTGQHWGNPIYDWHAMEKDGFAWWIARLKRDLARVDLVRLDHFRGFAQAWHIPAADKNALNGKWVDGPGAKLFHALFSALGGLPIIAEDLGLITPDVHALRTQFDLPGMRVLQFALGGPDSPHWPHNFVPHTACYTGTHDNDTSAGWFAKLNDRDQRAMGQYIGKWIDAPAAELVRIAWASVAVLAMAPLQDILELGAEARMNVPGLAEGNWGWRLQPDQFRPGMIERLAEFTVLYNRVAKPVGE